MSKRSRKLLTILRGSGDGGYPFFIKVRARRLGGSRAFRFAMPTSRRTTTRIGRGGLMTFGSRSKSFRLFRVCGVRRRRGKARVIAETCTRRTFFRVGSSVVRSLQAIGNATSDTVSSTLSGDQFGGKAITSLNLEAAGFCCRSTISSVRGVVRA